MRLIRRDLAIEAQHGAGPSGAFYLGDAMALLPGLRARYGGQVQLIYLDPPFATGQSFEMRMRVGEKDWRSGNGSLSLPAYSDPADADAYLDMMRALLTGCHALLSDSGSLFLHIDYRMSARLRLLMDEVFGEANFLNEIIWSYQTGGRAVRYFSRKHDTILFYRKTKQYFFDPEPVAIDRPDNRRNHMKRHIDTDGRVYRSIKSGGKVYTYYDDEKVFPGDVWDDVSHLQQKDPQRTGYDTQKPLPLLERIVKCASREGDLVCDLFSGSGTTLEAAHRNGRRFLGVDRSPMALHAIRRRLASADMRYHAPPFDGEPRAGLRLEPGVGFYRLQMDSYELEGGLLARAVPGLDALDSWSAGYLRDGEYVPMVFAYRTKATPQLPRALELPVLSGQPMVRLQDVLGRSFFYDIEMDEG